MDPLPVEVLDDEPVLRVAVWEREWPRPWMGPFLRTLSVLPNVAAACRQAGIGQWSVYAWRRKWDVFADGWDEALDMALDAMEEVLHRRAMLGEKRVVTTVRERVDASGAVTRETTTQESQEVETSALVAMLKAYRPERYRERYEHRVGALPREPSSHDRVARAPRTPERARELLELMAELGVQVRQREVGVIDGEARRVNGDHP